MFSTAIRHFLPCVPGLHFFALFLTVCSANVCLQSVNALHTMIDEPRRKARSAGVSHVMLWLALKQEDPRVTCLAP